MKKYIESEMLELKERYTDAMVREIVSFLNTNGGRILIGVRDDGTVAGVDRIDETLRRISDVVTGAIEPNPQDEVASSLIFDEGKTLIAIDVSKGSRNIYCQKKYGFSSTGCTVRMGTTCREMTAEQIRIRYERNFIDTEYMLKRSARSLDLSFRELKIYFAERGYHVDDRSFAANLSLKTSAGDYNLLAELLADSNRIPLIFVKFQGTNKTAISERSDYGYGCLLTAYAKLRNRLESENTCISNTTVRPRKDLYLFDADCVNEAVINALVHNDWTVSEPQVSMFQDRLEILSHGGLPGGMCEKDFFEGISRPRNTTLMRVFLMMGLCEHTGHGIPTIVNMYGKSVFDIEENYLRCTIPFDPDVLAHISGGNVGLNVGMGVGLNKTEKRVVELLIDDPDRNAQALAERIGVTKRTIERAFASLKEKGMLERVGSRRDGTWLVAKGKRPGD